MGFTAVTVMLKQPGLAHQYPMTLILTYLNKQFVLHLVQVFDYSMQISLTRCLFNISEAKAASLLRSREKNIERCKVRKSSILWR